MLFVRVALRVLAIAEGSFFFGKICIQNLIEALVQRFELGFEQRDTNVYKMSL